MFNVSLAYKNIKTGEYLSLAEYQTIRKKILDDNFNENYKGKISYFPEYFNGIGSTIPLPKELNNYIKLN